MGRSSAILAVRLIGLLAIAVAAGVLVTLGLAALAHEALVQTVGQEAIQATDPVGLALIGTAYLAGLVFGLAVFVIGWKRFLRGRG